MSDRRYWVYILANRAGMLYVGVTNDLERRIAEHRSGTVAGFTRRFGLKTLVHAEDCGQVEDAIAREKEIKGWRREKKLALIATGNPRCEDLAESLGDCRDDTPRATRSG